MGQKVNVKFVAILSVVVVVVVGALAVPAYMVLSKSASDHIKAGDKAMEAHEYKGAIRSYGKAVSDDRTSVAYLTKYREAIEHYVPEDRADFTKYLLKLYGAVYGIAYSTRTDLDAWEEYFEFARLMDSPTRIEEQARAAVELMRRADPVGADILLRYKSLPILSGWTSGRRQLEPDEVEILGEDLDAALAARGDDDEVADSLVSMHRYLASKAMEDRDEKGAREHALAAVDVVETFLKANPNHPIIRMTALELRANRAIQRLIGNENDPTTRAISEADLDQIAELLAAWPADDISLNDLGKLQGLEMIGTGSGALPRSLALTKRLVEERPDNMMLRWGRAFILRQVGRLQEAYDQLQVVLDRPVQTVSVEGHRLYNFQTQALYTQSGLAFQQWETSEKDASAREDALARMRTRHEELARRIPADSPLLLMTSARISYATDDLGEARRLVSEYETQVGDEDTDANWILSELAFQAGNLDEAGRRLDKYIELRPGEMRAMLKRADVHARLREFPEAIDILDVLVKAIPQSEELRDALKRLRVEAGLEESDDPILAALTASARAERGTSDEPGDPERAIAMIEEAIDGGLSSPQLYRRGAQIRLNQGRLDEARSMLERGLEANPTDESLKNLTEILRSGETLLDVSIAFVESSEAPALEKLIRSSSLCYRSNEFERSKTYLDQAVAIDPEDKDVVELGFRLALQADDLEAAAAFAQVAQRLDLDGVEGRGFLATLRAAENDQQSALTLLEEAVRLRPERVDMLQRLARQQLQMGHTNEGLASYENAMRLRGSSPPLILDYANQLRRLGRGERALRMLTEKESATSGNPAVFDLRIDLESEVGNRQWALDARKTLLERDPTDRTNRTKLARLLMKVSGWTEAKKLIDALRAEGDSLELATLAAQWHADQGDLAAGRETFGQYIAALFAEKGDLDDPTPYLQLGQLLIRYGDLSGGLEAIRQARRWEDPQTLRVEKFLGERLSALGRFEEAIESYKAVLEAGKDTPESSYALRLAELYGRIGRYEQAEEVLAGLTSTGGRGEAILLLRSQNAIQMNEFDRARELVGRAINEFPDSPRVYIQRARLAISMAQQTGNDQLYADAKEDLTTAIDRDPASADAYRVRSQANSKLGDVDGMLADLQSAIEATPPDNAFAAGVITVFLRMGRPAGAIEVADIAVSTRPNDLGLLKALGDAFSNTGDWNRGSLYFERAWERSKDLVTASSYIQSLLRSRPPRARLAMDALSKLGSQIDGDPGLLMARSESLMSSGQGDLAVEDAKRAFALLIQNPAGMSLWFNEVTRIFGTGDDFLAVITAAKRAGQNRMLLDLFAARGLALSENTLLQAVQIFDKLIAQTVDPSIQRSAYIFKGAAYMNFERYEDAVLIWQEGLGGYPLEWQFDNNIAYVLGDHLDRPAEALPYAARAVSRVPQNTSVLDTLGWLQHKMDDDPAAEQTLEQAMAIIGPPENAPTTALHLAIVRAALGKKSLADGLVRTIRLMTQDGANLDSDDRELLNKASELIDSLP